MNFIPYINITRIFTDLKESALSQHENQSLKLYNRVMVVTTYGHRNNIFLTTSKHEIRK